MWNKFFTVLGVVAGIVCISGATILAVSLAPMVIIPVGLVNIAYWCAGRGAAIGTGSLIAANTFFSGEYANMAAELEESRLGLECLNHRRAEQGDQPFVTIPLDLQCLQERLASFEADCQSNRTRVDVLEQQVQALVRNQSAQQTYQNRSEIRQRSLFQREATNATSVNSQPNNSL